MAFHSQLKLISSRRWPRFHLYGLVAVVGGAASLEGCATVGPGVEAVTWVGGAASFHLTGKGLTDHAISFATDQDCSLFRVLYRVSVCRPKVELQSVNGVLVAALPAPGEQYIVLGRFHDYREAEATARAHQAFHPRVAAWHASTTLYEVRIGPYGAERSESVQVALQEAGTGTFTVTTADDYSALAGVGSTGGFATEKDPG